METLRYAFPRSSTDGQGCVIISTRNNNMGDAACCESGGHVYHLQPLPQQEAKDLFHTKAFPGGSCPDFLKEMSDNVLQRCGGLPLAIVVIGSVLATKRNKLDEWAKFSLSLESEMEDDTLKRIRKVLSLSYYDLPYYLKSCLLYLSIFPEDVLLEKATIIRLWIAEGFVEAKQGKTMEDVVEGYLNELSNRSLIQVVMTYEDERPRNFHIHDLVREYISSKAREQNIIPTKSQIEITWDSRIRRLALDDSSISYGEKINFQYLRTLLFFGSADVEWARILCKVLRGEWKMLKVLDLRGATLDKIPNEIFKLYHFKYLVLRNTNVVFIPKLIGNLIKLKTLDLKGSKVVELSIEILKLPRLQYLLVYAYKFGIPYVKFGYLQSFEAPCEIAQLLRLQKLCYVDASADIVREIGKLTELRRLGIAKLRKEDGKELCSSLANLTFLSSLVILSLEESEVIDVQYYMPPTCLQFLRSLSLEGRLEELPQWMASLNALTRLTLAWSRMSEDPLKYLQGLPNLQILELHCAYEGEGLNFNSEGFQKLTNLYLHKLGGLRRMKVEKGSLPYLVRLDLWDCTAMIELPMGIEHLCNLEYVDLTDMAEEFVEKILEESKTEGDRWKLAHVPEVALGKFVDGEWKVRWL